MQSGKVGFTDMFAVSSNKPTKSSLWVCYTKNILFQKEICSNKNNLNPMLTSREGIKGKYK